MTIVAFSMVKVNKPAQLVMQAFSDCMVVGPFDWVLSLCNCPIFHSAGAVNPMGKLSNCRQLLSESDQSHAPSVST